MEPNMKSRPTIFLGFALLAISSSALNAQDAKMPTPPVTLQELAGQVISALEDQDYKRLQQLMIRPDEFAKRERIDKDDVVQYQAYYKDLPTLGKRYRKYLESNGLFMPEAKVKLTIRPGEDTTDLSTGVLAEVGKFRIEVIDQAVRVGKTWYVLRLVTGRDEKKLPR
jgi:hypothetical protein